MKKNLPVTQREKIFSEDARIISTTDPKGRITSFNNDFLQISGFEESELLGKNHNVVRHPDMPPAAFADLWRTVKANQSWMGIVKNRCKNGDHYWVDAFVTSIIQNGAIGEYQSVRVKASAERIARAEKVYQRINNNKKPFRRTLSLKTKLFAILAAVLLPSLATALVAPHFSWMAILLSLAMGAGLVHWQLAPLCQAFNESKKIVDNPLMQYIYTGRTDELGQLQLSEKLYRSQLCAVVSRLNFSSADLSDTAQKTEAVSKQSSDSVSIQQSSIEEISSSITEMSASIQQIARNAQDTSCSAKEADEEAGKGKEKLGTTVAAIEALSREIMSASDVIHRLSNESQSIGSVLDVIREIAEQTNMLALNAAIEAARAGEQGRGFAVVADEVRTLAVRTQDSIQEIEEMIERVQNSAGEATQVMEQSCDQAQQGAKQAQTILEFLDTITRDVGLIHQMTTDIAASTDQQMASAEGIHQNVINLSSQADRSVAITQESNEISCRLSQLTAQLKQLVHQFN